jgi:ABC-type ATPase involved in cell division
MIDVQELTKQFPLPGGRDLTAVDRVSFSVAAGEVYGLLGPNGAGKTTTLRMLLGLLRPTSGFAAIGGFRSVDYPDEVKRRVGLVAANAGLYQYLTAREMLLFFADLYGVSVAAAREELSRLASLLGLADFLDQYCSTLSTGQRQRVNLARALIHRPPGESRAMGGEPADDRESWRTTVERPPDAPDVQIVSFRSFVDDGGARLSHLLARLRAQGMMAFRLAKVFVTEAISITGAPNDHGLIVKRNIRASLTTCFSRIPSS